MTGQPGQPPRQGRSRYPGRAATVADRLGQAGNLAVQQRPRHLGRDVAGRQPGATRGQDDVVPLRDRRPQCVGDLLAVRQHHRPVDGEAHRRQTLDEDGPSAVGVDTGGGAVGRRDHECAPQPMPRGGFTRRASHPTDLRSWPRRGRR